MGFWHWKKSHKIQTTRSHASCCHRYNYYCHCNVDFVYSIISHATSIIFHHTLVLALCKSLISRALWLPHKCDVMEFRVDYYVLEFPTTKKMSKSKARRSLISLKLVHSFTPFWIFITMVAKSHNYFCYRDFESYGSQTNFWVFML
jgi:hypothetical protein